MKNLGLKSSTLIIFSLVSSISSIPIQAASITDDFTTGQVLDAATMTGIKDAVNDNDTRTTTNISNITSNTSAINTNSGNITTNTGNIATNTSAIGVNAANISANTANIGDNTSSTAINEVDILTNTTAISSLFGGDGSAGDLIVSTSVDWSAAPPTNPSFVNITIEAGQTLTVTAGTTIRCSGTFTNNGTLIVLEGAKMAGLSNFAFNATPDIFSYGHPGDSFRPASSGAYYTDGVTNPRFIQGGMGGEGIPKATTFTSFNSFRIGGGSGSGFRNPLLSGSGGGLVKIYCRGAITNSGTINANGNSPVRLSGGGGGGIVILASTTSVDNSSGAINAMGGVGGSSFAFSGAGGGGGGGIVAFIAPTINSGTINVTGGAGGDTSVSVTDNDRLGGGGGGASGGNGGDGSDIPPTATAIAGDPVQGSDGYSIEIVSNPAFLMY